VGKGENLADWMVLVPLKLPTPISASIQGNKLTKIE